MKIGCKIKSVVGMNFKKLLAKVVNLIFKYILDSYFVECGWRYSKGFHVNLDIFFCFYILLLCH